MCAVIYILATKLPKTLPQIWDKFVLIHKSALL